MTHDYEPRYMLGRLANGAERDCGRLWHAVPQNSNRAACGAKPGRRSVGWGPFDLSDIPAGQPITCPRCIASMGPRVNLAAPPENKPEDDEPGYSDLLFYDLVRR